MSNRISITPAMESKIRKISPDIDLEKVAAYETVAITTEPLNSDGLWYKARLTTEFLGEMRDFITAGNSVPLMEVHDQQGSLPVGRVFDAELVMKEEEGFLHTLFYVPEGEEISQNIENGILNSVSVSVLPKKLLCSECGWDYMGEDSDMYNKIFGICANDHEIGVDGVHTVGTQLDSFKELSLVMEGASKKAKIVSKDKQVMGKREREQYNPYPLAARIRREEVCILTAITRSSNLMAKDKDNAEGKAKAPELSMDFVGEFASVKAELIVSNKALETSEGALTASKEEIEKLKTELTGLEINAETKSDLESAVTFLKAEVKKALIILGKDADSIPETVSELTATLTESQVSIAKLFPVGGVSAGAEADEKEARLNSNAYKTFKTGE